MHSPLVLLGALCILAPALSALTVGRCLLRDQLRDQLRDRDQHRDRPKGTVPPRDGAVTEQLLATVLCEVENFNTTARVRREAGGKSGNKGPGGKDKDSSAQNSSAQNSKEPLADCISVANGKNIVNAGCIRHIFMSLGANASAACKTVDPVLFFQGCTGASASPTALP